MIEREMEAAVVAWLNRNGYDDVHEASVGGYCDIVGCAWSERAGRRKPDLLEMICVELKLKRITEVIDQAKANHFHANLSYCAMPASFICDMKPVSIQKFRDAGVGLLAVHVCKHFGWVKTVIYSNYQNKMPDVVFRDRLWANQVRNRKHQNRRNKQ